MFVFPLGSPRCSGMAWEKEPKMEVKMADGKGFWRGSWDLNVDDGFVKETVSKDVIFRQYKMM